ncbi:hypothetical protein ALQ15_200029 [Pseudomonas syringae pv. actinidiae]|uniref:Uncharacterized protein n=1 Tax=Pseudomonas syringae pv. actinidiae TaxID=103796 RepID=A0A7Z6U6R9_PSESF|nr:hypothetical protein ALQ15_200029 [Pseudomonas syringae pv. actinidiae]
MEVVLQVGAVGFYGVVVDGFLTDEQAYEIRKNSSKREYSAH